MDLGKRPAGGGGDYVPAAFLHLLWLQASLSILSSGASVVCTVGVSGISVQELFWRIVVCRPLYLSHEASTLVYSNPCLLQYATFMHHFYINWIRLICVRPASITIRYWCVCISALVFAVTQRHIMTYIFPVAGDSVNIDIPLCNHIKCFVPALRQTDWQLHTFTGRW